MRHLILLLLCFGTSLFAAAAPEWFSPSPDPIASFPLEPAGYDALASGSYTDMETGEISVLSANGIVLGKPIRGEAPEPVTMFLAAFGIALIGIGVIRKRAHESTVADK